MKKKVLVPVLVLAAVLALSCTVYASEDAEGIDGVAAPGTEDVIEQPLISPAPASSLLTAPEVRDELNLTAGTVVSDVYFLGESLSGMTLEEAVEHCKKPLNDLMQISFSAASSIYPENSVTASPADLGIKCGIDTIESQLDGVVVSGNLLERYKFAKDFQADTRIVDPKIEASTITIVNYLAPTLDSWHTEPQDASVSSMWGETVVTPGVTGMSYDCTEGVQKLVSDVTSLQNLPAAGGTYNIELDEAVVEPALTTERASTFTVIGSFSTAYFPPDTDRSLNRESNLANSTAHMNGSRFAPGEEISALTMYGPINEENGYKKAGTFNEGAHSVEMGGGICQTTTTLYNACLYAELEILYRNNHSMMITYADPSRDAMVYAQGNQDFKARNNTSDYIFINAAIDKGSHTIAVWITGHEDHPATHRVEYQSQITGIVPPEITRVEDPECGIGFGARYYLAEEDGPIPAITSCLHKITYEEGQDPKDEVLYNGRVDHYRGCGATYHISPVITLDLVHDSGASRESGYMALIPKYLDGTPLSANPAVWTDEERISFNERMTAACAEKGITWPYSGNGWNDDDPDGNLPEPTEAPEESSSAEETAPSTAAGE